MRCSDDEPATGKCVGWFFREVAGEIPSFAIPFRNGWKVTGDLDQLGHCENSSGRIQRQFEKDLAEVPEVTGRSLFGKLCLFCACSLI